MTEIDEQVVSPTERRFSAPGLGSIVLDVEPPAFNEAAELERQIAIRDLLESNRFVVRGVENQQVRLLLSTVGERIAVRVHTMNGEPLLTHILGATALRRLMNDYAAICGALTNAAAFQDPYKAEALDMTRRAIHDEASALLRARFALKIDMDTETSRRLFTLLFAYLWRGHLSLRH